MSPQHEPEVARPAWRRPGPWFALIAATAFLCLLAGLAPIWPALALAVFALLGLVLAGRGQPPAAGGAAVPAPVPPVLPATRSRVDAPLVALIAGLPEPALLLSPNGEILVANERVAAAVGPARVGDPVTFLVRVPQVLAAVRDAAEDGVPRRVEFAERVPLDRWLEAHVVPLHLHAGAAHPAAQGTAVPSASSRPAGKPDSVLLTFRDLTAQRRVEQMRADFVANASHELRTPLASLSGFIETLLGPARNDAAARERFLTIMGAQARRMSRLIDDLLSLSRIELNVHVRPDTPVDLNGILAHVCDTLTPLAQERGVEIALERASEAMTVRGDRDELIRLFENLVENGLKYGVNGKRVEVSLTREAGPAPGVGDGGIAVVAVRDFGPGIAPEHLPRLTERFYRVDVAASRDQGGTGLGLAIVKHIIARHRGRMAVESSPGAGAIFTVRLDLAGDVSKSDAISVA
ncbi:ATP-binding protein [Xanthobacteraceae bacterium A53D]